MNGANFDWKGAGYLFFVHSHWEVLGYGKEDVGGSGYEWALTCEWKHQTEPCSYRTMNHHHMR
jgi:hypothetical protein